MAEPEAEISAETAMTSEETEEATQAAVNAENMANQINADELTSEEEQQVQAKNYKAQVKYTGQILKSSKSKGVNSPTDEQIDQLQYTSKNLSESVSKPGEILPKLEESASTIDEDAANLLNSSMRPFFEVMNSKIDYLIEKNSGKSKFSQFKALQYKVTKAVENKDPAAYEEATTNLDSFIEQELSESKTALEEKTEGRGNLIFFSRIESFLKLLGIAGILGLITTIFMMDNGCWEWTDGAKTKKINDFDFNTDNNKRFCACSDNNNFDTPQPLSSWCPSGITKGSPTYVTCPPYQYPACTINTDPSGIYYSYYTASPLGVFNSLVNQTSKVIKDTGQNILIYVKWAVVIICILIILYLIIVGLVEEDWLYAVGVLIMAVAATAGWIFI